MIKQITIITLLILFATMVKAQDTVVVRDYSAVLIKTSPKGEIYPVTDISKERNVGFFINNKPEGIFRICNAEEVFLWANGKLVSSSAGCTYVDPEVLYEVSHTDTVFLTLTTQRFENFRCELVKVQDLIVIKEDVKRSRYVRSSTSEFHLIAILMLLFITGLYAFSFTSRLHFLFYKTLSQKPTGYKYVNISFYHNANLLLTGLVSCYISFCYLYILNNHQHDANPTDLVPSTLYGHLQSWIAISLIVFSLYFTKSILVQSIGSLYKMKGLKNIQLFDFINFSGYFIFMLFGFLVLDFIFNYAATSWVNIHFHYYFVIVLLLFNCWLIIKLAINSSYEKLLIISYFCATEFLPSIFILVWFFN